MRELKKLRKHLLQMQSTAERQAQSAKYLEFRLRAAERARIAAYMLERLTILEEDFKAKENRCTIR